MDKLSQEQNCWQDFKAEETNNNWLQIILHSLYLWLHQPPTGTQEAESLQFLPAESQASLAALGHIVDKKMSKLKADSELETTRFRQAVNLNFINKHCIQDPCGKEPGYKRIITCFIKQLMMDHNSWSATVRGYVEAINALLWLRKFDAPANLTDRANMCSKIILAREKEESFAWQLSPITREIYSVLLNQAKKSPIDSVEMVVADWFTLIRITGLCCTEYAQKTQT